MLPKLNKKRGLFVLAKIDEIQAWEQWKEAERNTRFVELGGYWCEVRAGQYWRLENLKSFDEFLGRRFMDANTPGRTSRQEVSGPGPRSAQIRVVHVRRTA